MSNNKSSFSSENKNKNKGVKNQVLSFIVIVCLIGSIFAWAKVNNIKSIESVYQYFKSGSEKVGSSYKECSDGEKVWNCRKDEKPADPSELKKEKNFGNSKNSKSSKGSQKLKKDSSNLDYLGALDSLKVSEPSDVHYSRSEWRHWIGKPCNTRETVLKNSGKNVKTDKKTCKILSGSWVSDYDGKTFTNPKDLDIDHVIPLGYAARHGAQAWAPEKKQAFANDTSQLLAVSAKENRSKGDKGPSEYMPQRSFHCQYSKIWIATAEKYGVSVTEKDKFVLKDGIQKC